MDYCRAAHVCICVNVLCIHGNILDKKIMTKVFVVCSDVEKIQSGLGDRVAIFIQFTSTFLSGFTVAFVFNWRLALVVVSVLPFMVVITAALTRVCVCVCVRVSVLVCVCLCVYSIS